MWSEMVKPSTQVERTIGVYQDNFPWWSVYVFSRTLRGGAFGNMEGGGGGALIVKLSASYFPKCLALFGWAPKLSFGGEGWGLQPPGLPAPPPMNICGCLEIRSLFYTCIIFHFPLPREPRVFRCKAFTFLTWDVRRITLKLYNGQRSLWNLPWMSIVCYGS